MSIKYQLHIYFSEVNNYTTSSIAIDLKIYFYLTYLVHCFQRMCFIPQKSLTFIVLCVNRNKMISLKLEEIVEILKKGQHKKAKQIFCNITPKHYINKTPIN